jgi:hypothetical protein
VRARKLDAGADFIFEPRALVWHKIPAKRLTYRYFWLRCYAENYQRPTYPPCSPRSTFCRWNGGTYWRCSHVVSRVAFATRFCALIQEAWGERSQLRPGSCSLLRASASVRSAGDTQRILPRKRRRLPIPCPSSELLPSASHTLSMDGSITSYFH